MKEIRRMMRITNKLYKLMVLMLVMVLSTVILTPSTIKAAVYYKGTSKPIAIKYRHKKSGSEIGIVRHYVDGVQAYCVEAYQYYQSEDKKLITLDDYQKFSPDIKRRLELIDYYGKMLGSLSDDQVHVTVQFMIWELTDGVDASDYEFFNGMTNSDFERIRTSINQSIDKHSVVVSFDQGSYRLNRDENLQLVDNNQVLKDFVFTSSDPSIVSVTQSGNTLNLTAHQPGSVTLRATKVSKDYSGTSLVFFSENDPTKQDVATFKVKDELAASISVTVNEFSQLKIKKENEKGEAVNHTSFNLSNHSSMNPLIGTYTTNEQGVVLVDQLLPGTYYLQEVSVPAPYILNPTVYPVVLKAQEITTFTQVNQAAKGTISIRKVDTNNQVIAGAVFEIRNSSGIVVDTIKTNPMGVATTQILPLGDYVIIETFVPSPYLLDSTPIPVSLEYQDQYQQIVLTQKEHLNKEPKGLIELTKLDEETSEPLSGVAFELKDDQGMVVDTLVTNEVGKAQSSEIPLGVYTLEEIEPSVGYVTDKTVHTIELKYVDMNTPLVSVSIQLNNKPIKGQIQIVKVDANNEEFPIEGAKFGIYKLPEKVLVEEVTSDIDGFAYSSLLRYGDYLIKELEAPEQYYLSTDEYPISIKEHGKINVQYIKNDQVQIRLKVNKIDSETKTPLSKAVFEIKNDNNEVVTFEYLNDNNEIVKTNQLITNDKGEAYTKGYLSVGSYTLTEVKAPDGYLKSEPIPFTIDRNTESVNLEIIGQTKTVTVSNDKTQVEIRKVDVHFNPVSGAHLKVVDENNTIISEWMSDEQPLLIKGLHVDNVYQLIEVKAPTGYLLSEPVTFKVKETKEMQQVFMINERIPSLSTEAYFDTKTKESMPLESINITDTVTYLDVVINKTYLLKGSLIDFETNEVIAVSQKEFIPQTTEGTISIDFSFNATEMSGKKIVVFEELYDGQRLVASHKDRMDKNQTLYFPNMMTLAVDEVGNKETLPINDIKLIDTVSYSSLRINQEYTLVSQLVLKETLEVLLTKETVFTAEKEQGSIDILFTLDARELADQQVVFFQTLFVNQEELLVVAEHKDIDDPHQTITILKPSLQTTATFENGLKESHAISELIVVDTVEYTNLIVGKKYTIKGQLLNQQAIANSQVEFVPTQSSGVVEVEFNINGNSLGGQFLVVFEELYFEDTRIASHKDINDKQQTVSIIDPQIDTTVTVFEQDDSSSLIKVMDIVKLEGLISGNEYKLITSLVNKETKKNLIDEFETTFVAESKSVSKLVSFKIDRSLFKSGEYVVVQYLLFNGELISKHDDLDDSDQTFRITELVVKKIDSETKEPLKGVEFVLLHHGIVVDKKVSDSHGRINFVVIEDNYELRETKALDGYLLDGKDIKIENNHSNQPIELEVENKRIVKELPKAGDQSSIVSLLGFFLMSSGLIVFSRRRKVK